MTQPQAQSDHYLSDEDDTRGHLCLDLPERLDVTTTTRFWSPWTAKIRSSQVSKVIIEAEKLKQCDGSGFGLISYLHKASVRHHKSFEIKNLNPSLKELLQHQCPSLEQAEIPSDSRPKFLSVLGQKTCHLINDVYEQLSFLGHLLLTAFTTALHPRRFRYQEFVRMTELAGADALGIMSLLGFLFGLIMSFSSAMPMAQFGVEIYVVDLVAFAMTRVLGPFVAAILLAGRTGSAYAAELGTMKINNELDALEVMNLKPMSFLVLPRVAATIIMAPLLSIITVLVSLIGCVLVVLSMGYPMTAFYSHVQDILTTNDVWIGLFKALIFGGIVGAVGCLRGLQTKTGSGAVGLSTTRAVVTSIVLLVMAEGVFSILLYVLEL